MRYLKIASAKNPSTDYIELNNFEGFFCTSFQTLGISRNIDSLVVGNRQFSVSNNPQFHKYRLTIEILTKYNDYEKEYSRLIAFFDRNKKSGLRLYYKPYEGMKLLYCLCDIEAVEKAGKRQPVYISIIQNSLWLGEEKIIHTLQKEVQDANLFAFMEDDEISDYYAAAFIEDEDVSYYYCVRFYRGAITYAEIENSCYNEIPLNFKIYSPCVNPMILLYKKGEITPIRRLQVIASIYSGYIEIDSNISSNGVFYKQSEDSIGIDYSELLDNSFGSPYFYVDNGEYYIEIRDANQNVCYCDIIYQEEYSDEAVDVLL